MSFKAFLDWLGRDNGPEKKSSVKDDPYNWTEKRRDNRVELEDGHVLNVRLKSADDEEKTFTARVRNVSVRGCGLIFKNSAERAQLEPKQIFVATLAVDDFPIPLQVEVIRLMGDTEAAVKFKPPFPRELEKLEKFLEPRCLGRSLREIDRAKLQKNQDKGMRWFQGVNETHLFSWTDSSNGHILQQQLVFLDRVVEWRENNPVRTGLTRQDQQVSDAVEWVKSELLDFDAVADSAVVHQARVLIESARIDSKIKEAFLKKL